MGEFPDLSVQICVFVLSHYVFSQMFNRNNCRTRNSVALISFFLPSAEMQVAHVFECLLIWSRLELVDTEPVFYLTAHSCLFPLMKGTYWQWLSKIMMQIILCAHMNLHLIVNVSCGLCDRNTVWLVRVQEVGQVSAAAAVSSQLSLLRLVITATPDCNVTWSVCMSD